MKRVHRGDVRLSMALAVHQILHTRLCDTGSIGLGHWAFALSAQPFD